MKGAMVVCEHLSGEFTDITFEMLGLATSLDSGEVSGVTFGAMGGKSGELGAASNVILAGGGDEDGGEAETGGRAGGPQSRDGAERWERSRSRRI